MSETRIKAEACLSLPVDQYGDADPDRADYETAGPFASMQEAAEWATGRDIFGEGQIVIEEKYYVEQYDLWQWGPVEWFDARQVLENKT